MRLYEPDGATLQALKGSNIEVMLGVPNRDLQRIAGDDLDLTPAAEYLKYMRPIIGFLAENGSPLCANIYPYLSNHDNQNSMRLDYALFTAPRTVVNDGRFRYHNLFDALLDSFYAAVEKVGGSSVRIVVSETGWPSAGDPVAEDCCTRNPNGPIETYIKLDENTKPGAETQGHFGPLAKCQINT
uniref:Glucan endo-1,3-beta-D-glucosidase n=1 Tax=Nelumbo nucifera TaxID=4432 RepID=A0A822YCF8_NELNU|nr:TPA_asm: hypothetical protein HUJ06_031271 [Nelumbo nucifera]